MEERWRYYMALVVATITQSMEAAIRAALDTEFAKESSADPTAHQRMAAAIARGVTQVIVEAITTTAEVLPGIPVVTTGSATEQVGETVAPGHIL
jgi:hypothetical protein